MAYPADELWADLKKADAAGDEELAKHIAGLIREAESGPVDYQFSESVKNLPGSLAREAQGMWDVISDPVGAVQAMGNLGGSVLEKGQRKVREVASGADIEPTSNEAMADTAWEGLVDTYGSWDAIKKTAMEDPARLLLDVASVVTGAGTAARIPQVTRVGQMADPINIAAKAVQVPYQAGVKAFMPAGKPAAMYKEGLKLPPTMNRKKREKITETLLDQGIMPTDKGIAKRERMLGRGNEALDELIQGSDVYVPVETTGRHMGELADDLSGTIGGAEKTRQANRIFEEYISDQWAMGKSELTPADLQKMKVKAYEDINWDAKHLSGTPIKEETYKTMARGAKDAISEQIPEAAEINKLLGELYETSPALENAASRIENLNKFGLGTPAKIGGSTAVGEWVAGMPGLGTLAGTLMTLRDNPLLKSRVAIHLNKIDKGDIDWVRKHRADTDMRLALHVLSLTQQLEEQAKDQTTE